MPADMSRYPRNWREIRAAILERANNQCERCGVENGACGYRAPDGSFWTEQMIGESQECHPFAGKYAEPKPLIIVLTIAHINDPDPQNCDPDNLQALCQRCHNRLDAPMRAKHAAATRKERRRAASGQLELL